MQNHCLSEILSCYKGTTILAPIAIGVQAMNKKKTYNFYDCHCGSDDCVGNDCYDCHCASDDCGDCYDCGDDCMMH